MAKKKEPKPSTAALPEPRIYEATLGANGAVVKGTELTQAQAESRRKAGQDVVVCGDNLTMNRQMAGEIERNANGKSKRCPPHANAGANALPHYQPDPRGQKGHTFYETPNRKAV